MTKPEAQYVQSINGKLKERYSRVYHQSMYTPFSGGTPDQYYEGPDNNLWVEYKYISTLSRVFIPFDLCTGPQQKWLNRAVSNEQKVALIVGSRDGGYIFQPHVWLMPWSTPCLDRFRATKLEIVTWIAQEVDYTIPLCCTPKLVR